MKVRGASSRLLKQLRTIASLQFLLRDAEGVAGEIGATYIILRIQNIAKFITGKSTNTCLFKPDPSPLIISF